MLRETVLCQSRKTATSPKRNLASSQTRARKPRISTGSRRRRFLVLSSFFSLGFLPPSLHLDLGLTISIFEGDCKSLGRTVVDEGNPLKLAERVEDIEELGHVVVECMDTVVELLVGKELGCTWS